MTMSVTELRMHLAALSASIEDLRAGYEDDAFVVEAVASAGEDLADLAGEHRCWVEDAVAQILVRHGLMHEPVDDASGER